MLLKQYPVSCACTKRNLFGTAINKVNRIVLECLFHGLICSWTEQPIQEAMSSDMYTIRMLIIKTQINFSCHSECSYNQHVWLTEPSSDMFLHMKDIWLDINDIWVFIDNNSVSIDDILVAIDNISVVMDTFTLPSWSCRRSTCWWQYEVMLVISSVWFWAVISKPFNSAWIRINRMTQSRST